MTWLGLAIVLLAAGPALAQAPADEAAGLQVDDVVRTHLAERNIPSVVVAVVRDGAIVKVAAYGDKRLGPGSREPATPRTVYRLDSITKQFTAAGIMLLVQDGRVDLDARVKRYLPAAPPSWEAITVRHLLTHTSGLAHDPPNGYPPVAEQNRDPGAVLVRLFRMRPEFEPGSRYAYSNAGFEALAAVIHRVSGLPYLRFMRERIFEPVGMESTTLDFFGRPEPERAFGYALIDGAMREARARTFPMGAGCVQSNAFDLARWDAALYTDRILTDESKRQMWTPTPLTTGRTQPYGFGWALRRLRGGRVVFHNGGGAGFNNAFYRYLDARLTVIVLTNSNPERLSGGRGSHADELARLVAPLYRPDLAWTVRRTPLLNEGLEPSPDERKDAP